jgi:hypothetical protein
LGINDDHPNLNSKKTVCVELLAEEKMLDPLDKFRSGLLWREQQRSITKESTYFVSHSVWELVDKLVDKPSHIHICIYKNKIRIYA